jgi:hypothetical protein
MEGNAFIGKPVKLAHGKGAVVKYPGKALAARSAQINRQKPGEFMISDF